jgi:23S rRNA (guanosine2251-2'-O)-methyltransferase
MERVPYQATAASRVYDGLTPLPVSILLEDVRSQYNVGAFFRTADAARIERLLLCGITAIPPQRGIAKTALGAEQTVAWEYRAEAGGAIDALRSRGYQIAAVDTGIHALDLFDWEPRFPVCLIFGNEIDGIRPETAARADAGIRIPMLGLKHSLNVATAGGILIYELLRKWRRLRERS